MTSNAILVLASAILAVAFAGILDHQKLNDIHAQCQADPATRIDESAIDAGSHNIENIGPHTFCMISKAGLLTADGDVNKEILRDYVSKISEHDSAKVDEIVTDCGKRDGATPVDAAVALKKCLGKYEKVKSHSRHHH